MQDNKIKKRLLLLGKKNPFTVKDSGEEGIDLKIEWVIADAKWWEVLGKAWKNITYTAFVTIDEKAKIVRYQEKLVKTSITKLSFKWGGSITKTKGQLINTRTRKKQYGIREDGTIGEVLAYDFNPKEIKDVVRQIAEEEGWGFKVHLFKRSLRIA